MRPPARRSHPTLTWLLRTRVSRQGDLEAPCARKGPLRALPSSHAHHHPSALTAGPPPARQARLAGALRVRNARRGGTTSWPSSACSKCQDFKQFKNGAQRRIAAAAALQTEAALRAVAGALDGPLEKARARELSTRARCVPLRIAPGRHAQGGTHGDWQQVPQDVLLQHGPMPAAPTRNCAVLWPVWALWCASGPKSCVFSLFPTMKKAAVVCSVTVGFFLSSPCSGLIPRLFLSLSFSYERYMNFI